VLLAAEQWTVAVRAQYSRDLQAKCPLLAPTLLMLNFPLYFGSVGSRSVTRAAGIRAPRRGWPRQPEGPPGPASAPEALALRVYENLLLI